MANGGHCRRVWCAHSNYRYSLLIMLYGYAFCWGVALMMWHVMLVYASGHCMEQRSCGGSQWWHSAPPRMTTKGVGMMTNGVGMMTKGEGMMTKGEGMMTKGEG